MTAIIAFRRNKTYIKFIQNKTLLEINKIRYYNEPIKNEDFAQHIDKNIPPYCHYVRIIVEHYDKPYYQYMPCFVSKSAAELHFSKITSQYNMIHVYQWYKYVPKFRVNESTIVDIDYEFECTYSTDILD